MKTIRMMLLALAAVVPHGAGAHSDEEMLAELREQWSRYEDMHITIDRMQWDERRPDYGNVCAPGFFIYFPPREDRREEVNWRFGDEPVCLVIFGATSFPFDGSVDQFCATFGLAHSIWRLRDGEAFCGYIPTREAVKAACPPPYEHVGLWRRDPGRHSTCFRKRLPHRPWVSPGPTWTERSADGGVKSYTVGWHLTDEAWLGPMPVPGEAVECDLQLWRDGPWAGDLEPTRVLEFVPIRPIGSYTFTPDVSGSHRFSPATGGSFKVAFVCLHYNGESRWHRSAEYVALRLLADPSVHYYGHPYKTHWHFEIPERWREVAFIPSVPPAEYGARVPWLAVSTHKHMRDHNYDPVDVQIRVSIRNEDGSLQEAPIRFPVSPGQPKRVLLGQEGINAPRVWRSVLVEAYGEPYYASGTDVAATTPTANGARIPLPIARPAEARGYAYQGFTVMLPPAEQSGMTLWVSVTNQGEEEVRVGFGDRDTDGACGSSISLAAGQQELLPLTKCPDAPPGWRRFGVGSRDETSGGRLHVTAGFSTADGSMSILPVQTNHRPPYPAVDHSAPSPFPYPTPQEYHRQAPEHSEPPRETRRVICLSQAAIADSCNG